MHAGRAIARGTPAEVAASFPRRLLEVRGPDLAAAIARLRARRRARHRRPPLRRPPAPDPRRRRPGRRRPRAPRRPRRRGGARRVAGIEDVFVALLRGGVVSDDRRPRARPDPPLRRVHRRRRHRPRRRRRARSSASSAPTAPARPRPSACSAACCRPAAARRRWPACRVGRRATRPQAAHRLHEPEVQPLRRPHRAREPGVLRRRLRPEPRSGSRARAEELLPQLGLGGHRAAPDRRRCRWATSSASRSAARCCTSRASSSSTSPPAASTPSRAAASGT